jgi:hypothetical protein
MTAVQKVPGKGELKSYLNAGLTQAQIVEAWEKDSGHRVSRSSIAMAIARYSLKSAHQRPRYEELLPWVVAEVHLHDTEARMLRLEGRRRQKGEKSISPAELRWLESWKAALKERDLVIHYDRDAGGFLWMERSEAIEPWVDPNAD